MSVVTLSTSDVYYVLHICLVYIKSHNEVLGIRVYVTLFVESLLYMKVLPTTQVI
jgi:hypothetical protein